MYQALDPDRTDHESAGHPPAPSPSDLARLAMSGGPRRTAVPLRGRVGDAAAPPAHPRHRPVPGPRRPVLRPRHDRPGPPGLRVDRHDPPWPADPLPGVPPRPAAVEGRVAAV